jgi:hypothetical protein
MALHANIDQFLEAEIERLKLKLDAETNPVERISIRNEIIAIRNGIDAKNSQVKGMLYQHGSGCNNRQDGVRTHR